ncbi:AraC family transcriptional regulator [Kaistia dalseonensis]|uniref:AraC-like DNA-binding protein n=1 Tax=Kaistia dalseonensis TaxID=410840 RepID=A0ABU0H8A6_9HYPH|nr:AraC family transcriptional regulator [Kaistia dalseonensis]MCX5495644.1 AraC family transcriptional regulator [Kaistia dalseonensis]MDQ0438237.1 AraC-like DNA-binding protein [Kaistia dalseonensis]
MESLQPVPLEPFRLVDTPDVDEAREAIGRIFCPHFLVPRTETALFRARHHAVSQPGYSVNFVSYGAEVEIDPGELSRFFLLQIPLKGGAEVRSGARATMAEAGRRATILSPTIASRMVWGEGCEKLIVLMWRESVEQLCGQLTSTQSGAIEFEAGFDLTSPVGQGVLHHAQLLLNAAEQGASLPDAYRVMLRDGLATLLLSGLAHSRSALFARPEPECGPRAVRQALQFIEAEYARPISVADIAEASGASLRALQDAFRKARHETLWQAVQGVRLEKLRASLIAATETTTVATAVYAVGLGHLGRAAAAYQARFGESPSETLRRAPRR